MRRTPDARDADVSIAEVCNTSVRASTQEAACDRNASPRSMPASRALLRGAAIAMALGMACYANSLHGQVRAARRWRSHGPAAHVRAAQFVMDDDVAVVRNADLRPDTPWAQLWRNDFWGTPVHTEESHKSYRPLTVATFRLNYVLGGLDPFGYHLLNVILHGLCTYLCVFVAHVAFGSTDVAVSSGPRIVLHGVLIGAQVATGLLFGTHPVHTEAVSGVVGRAEVLSGVLYFSSFLLYVRGAFHAQWRAPPRPQFARSGTAPQRQPCAPGAQHCLRGAGDAEQGDGPHHLGCVRGV